MICTNLGLINIDKKIFSTVHGKLNRFTSCDSHLKIHLIKFDNLFDNRSFFSKKTISVKEIDISFWLVETEQSLCLNYKDNKMNFLKKSKTYQDNLQSKKSWYVKIIFRILRT